MTLDVLLLQMIENYIKATESSWRKTQLLDVWEIDRSGAVTSLVIMVHVCIRVIILGQAFFCSSKFGQSSVAMAWY